MAVHRLRARAGMWPVRGPASCPCFPLTRLGSACAGQGDPSQSKYHKIHPHYTVEPETGRVNWCRANLDRCKGHCN